MPRPETELLAGWAVEPGADAAGRRPVVVDLCTGSGAIALAVAAEVPAARVHAVELDEARARLGGAQPGRHRGRPAAGRHGRRVPRTSPAPSTWSSATRRTSRSRPWSPWPPRRATTTRSWPCCPATTAWTRCGSSSGAAAAAAAARGRGRRRARRRPGRVGAGRVRARRAVGRGARPPGPGRSSAVRDGAAGTMSPSEHADRRPCRDRRGRAARPAIEAAAHGRPARRARRAADRHRLRRRRRRVRPRRRAAPARRQGPGPRDAAAGAGLRRDHARGARRRRAGVRPCAGRGSSGRARSPWSAPAAVPAVGPGRHPGHGRGPDARPRGRPGAPRAHRPAGGELREPHRPARGDRRRRRRGDARRRGAVFLDGGPAAGAVPSTIVDVHRRTRPGAAAGRALPGASSTQVVEPLGAETSTDEG